MIKKLIVANWKLQPETWREAKELFGPVKRAAGRLRRTETVVCPPAIFLLALAQFLDPRRSLALGGQDAFFLPAGAHTGEIAPGMIKSAGARYLILGHSEKRALVDTDSIVNQKVKAALGAGLKVILCVGERERDQGGEYLGFLRRQLEEGLAGVPRRLVGQVAVAYEPLWAIGGDASAADTPAGFLEQALFVRKILTLRFGRQAAGAVRVLYGGSVTPQNAAGFLGEGEADGLLVGHESLRPNHFVKILEIADSL